MGCNKPLLKQKQKQKHKKGLWSPEEDFRLRNYVVKHGNGCWSSVPINAGLQRTGKSCRLRWMNYLRPGLKRGIIDKEEEQAILTLHAMLGNKWSQIAQHLPGRTDNEIKNYWHSYLKKRMPRTEQNQTQKTPKNTSPNTTSTEPSFSLHSQESIIHYPSFNSYDNIDRSSMSTKRDTILPRVWFAEWLSLDQFQSQGLSTSIGVPEVPKDVESKQDCEDSFLNNFLLNEGVFSCGFLSDDDVSSHFDQR